MGKGFPPSNATRRVAASSFQKKSLARSKSDAADAMITGKVIRGDHYGRVLGFPTANIDRRDYQRRKLNIKFGVWAGTVEIINSKFEIRNSSQSFDGTTRRMTVSKFYPAGIVVGPLDKNNLPKIEAHLIGFKGNLYGKKISIELIKFIRPYKAFKNIEALKKQIATDIKKVSMGLN
jgi:riboflavin kinase/FMN adenylyltransferase